MTQLLLSSQPRAISVDFALRPSASFCPASRQTSNRYSKLLDSSATHAKQTSALISNRDKMRCSPVPVVDGANENPRPTAHGAQFAASQARAPLIANEMRSPASTTISKHATYIFLIANEFHSQTTLETTKSLQTTNAISGRQFFAFFRITGHFVFCAPVAPSALHRIGISAEPRKTSATLPRLRPPARHP